MHFLLFSPQARIKYGYTVNTLDHLYGLFNQKKKNSNVVIFSSSPGYAMLKWSCAAPRGHILLANSHVAFMASLSVSERCGENCSGCDSQAQLLHVHKTSVNRKRSFLLLP